MLIVTRARSAKRVSKITKGDLIASWLNQIACAVVVFAIHPSDCHEAWKLPQKEHGVTVSRFDIQSPGGYGPTNEWRHDLRKAPTFAPTIRCVTSARPPLSSHPYPRPCRLPSHPCPRLCWHLSHPFRFPSQTPCQRARQRVPSFQLPSSCPAPYL